MLSVNDLYSHRTFPSPIFHCESCVYSDLRDSKQASIKLSLSCQSDASLEILDILREKIRKPTYLSRVDVHIYMKLYCMCL